MEEQKEEKKKFQKWPIVVLVLLIILVIGSTFAWFTLTKTSEKVNTIKAGSLSMVLDDEASDGILLQKAIPMSYQQGVATTDYTFTLTNNGSKGDYTISLLDEATYADSEGVQVTIEDTKRIADTKIRYILLKDGEVAEASKSMLLSEAVDRVIDSGTIENGTTIRYSLRIWIDSKASNEVMGQIFNARLQLDATQHQVLKLCKRASTLHTEICSQTSENCSADGYASGDIITYGNLGTSGILTTGDAFDCDVNGDGRYDKTKERFYYVSDMNNGITTDADTAVLIYYTNVSEGEPDNLTAYAYHTSSRNNYGPATALVQLPTIIQWNNVSLINTTRTITNQSGGTGTANGSISPFSYEGYAARLLTYQEINAGCYDGTTAITSTGGLSSKCKFLMENTKYSSSALGTYGTWLETPSSFYFYDAWYVYSNARHVDRNVVTNNASLYGVRPAIEVPKSRIEY